MTPRQAAIQCLWSLLYGAGLGAWYDFLRPLRPQRTALADLAFVAAMLWAGISFGFGICEGDLRVGYLAVALAGGMLGGWMFGRHICRILETGGEDLGLFSSACEKKFEFWKKSVCI